jgi:hypothetical protein
MRTLSRRQAQRCEDGEGKRCRCRCGGKYHGARRGEVSHRPPGDPHHVPRLCDRCSTDVPPHRRRACARLPVSGLRVCRRCFDQAQRELPLGHTAAPAIT